MENDNELLRYPTLSERNGKHTLIDHSKKQSMLNYSDSNVTSDRPSQVVSDLD